VVTAAGLCALIAPPIAAAGKSARSPGSELANGCIGIQAGETGRYLASSGGSYAASASRRAGAERFFLKPTSLHAFLISDRSGRLLAASGRQVVAGSIPARAAQWRIADLGHGLVEIRSGPRGLELAGDAESLRLRRGAAHDFRAVSLSGCRPYPEAGPGATGRLFRGTRPDGSVFGFADTHLHVTANLRAGGLAISGKPFDRFGITEALGHDAEVHGPDGSADVTGNLLRDGIPFGTHDTNGWPTFTGWPVHDTNTHQQVYYGWLQRAYAAGLRLVVAEAVEDQPLCEIEPVRSHSCDETETIKLAIRQLQALERYVDAQAGGRGQGWFRLVRSPGQARRVIADGKLAVVTGVESSNPFGCSETSDCDRRDVNRGLRRMERRGVRSMFVAHWVDNAFAGAALEGGTKGVFINIFNQYQTGHYFRTGPCPDPSQGEEVNTIGPGEQQILAQFFPAAAGLPPMPSYPEGKQCNTKGLTKLGAYLLRRMMDRGMMIELDHMSERARDRALEIAAARDYPLVSGHTGTGGSWTPAELTSLLRHGGVAAATPAAASELADKLLAFRPYRDRHRPYGVGLGTDTGGFSSLPGPSEDPAAPPLAYPFRSYDGKVRFTRQRTGERVFDLNADGVAHYGLFADLLARMQRGPDGRRAMRVLFRSAESYLTTWEAARKHADQLR
jgi:microsomal dipeptidase-like Zn-dependent dipeptidase